MAAARQCPVQGLCGRVERSCAVFRSALCSPFAPAFRCRECHSIRPCTAQSLSLTEACLRDYRLVARTLERRWNEKLQQVEALEQAYAVAQRTQRLDITPQERQQILRLAADLPAVWQAPTTTQAERKELLGRLVKQIALTPVEGPQRQTRGQLLWHTTATTTLEVPRLRAAERIHPPRRSLRPLGPWRQAGPTPPLRRPSMRRALPVVAAAPSRRRPWPGSAIIIRSANLAPIGRWPPAPTPVPTDAIPRAPSPHAWASALRRFITGGSRAFSPPSRSCLGGPGGMRLPQQCWRGCEPICAGHPFSPQRSILNTSWTKVHYEHSIGIPNGRSFPLLFGIYVRRTALERYVPLRNRSQSRWIRGRSTSSAVSLSVPGV
jgi:hypothetical protein